MKPTKHYLSIILSRMLRCPVNCDGGKLWVLALGNVYSRDIEACGTDLVTEAMEDHSAKWIRDLRNGRAPDGFTKIQKSHLPTDVEMVMPNGRLTELYELITHGDGCDCMDCGNYCK